MRSGPSKTASVLGSAAQGAVLALLAHTKAGGGWYKVQGATLTGWVSSDPAYSAKGLFAFYSAPAFSVLYPSGWSESGSPSTGVTFKSPNPGENVVIKAASKFAKLPVVNQGAGVSVAQDDQEVACGVTGHLYLYSTPDHQRFLALFDVATASDHALGLKAVLRSPAQLSTVLDFINSVSFQLPVCVGGPPPKKTTTPKAHTTTPTTKATPTTTATPTTKATPAT